MQVKLLHKTSSRARFQCLALNEDLNLNKLQSELQKLQDGLQVRINKRACSIIFSATCLDVNFLQNYLADYNVENLKSCQNICAQSLLKKKQAKPSLNNFAKAMAVLGTEPFVQNPFLKMALTAIATKSVVIGGTKELFAEGLTSKVLEALAIVVSLTRKDYLAANSTNALLKLGEYIEETTVNKSDDLIKELAKPKISTVWIERLVDGKYIEEQISSKDIQIGDIVVVGTGDIIAIDGHIISGTASINQISMTGESEPVNRHRGDRVISGTIVEDGRIKIWAEQVGDDTATERIKTYISSSLNEKSSVGLKAAKLADKLVPVTLGFSAFSYLINRNFQSVAAVLQADYSCALKLATPVTFKSAISHAGKRGVMIKGAKSIEALNLADTFVFDKTGTLTYGELDVDGVISFDKNWTNEDILNLTASAEEHYFHPVAQAVVKAAQRMGFVHIHHEEVKFIVAHGVKTIVEEKELVIGSRHFLEDDEGIDFSEYTKDVDASLNIGKTLLYVGYNKKLLGMVTMTDRLRENAKNMISELKKLGVKKTIMLTGDIETKAKAFANELGIDEVYANMEPADKAEIIQKLKDQGCKVAFVGDGINDAPALINANVGISMSKGADIAKATADIGLLTDDIESIVQVKAMAMNTMKLINYNFNAAVGINSAILLGATFNLFSPITTAVLHNGTTILLLLNAVKAGN